MQVVVGVGCFAVDAFGRREMLSKRHEAKRMSGLREALEECEESTRGAIRDEKWRRSERAGR